MVWSWFLNLIIANTVIAIDDVEYDELEDEDIFISDNNNEVNEDEDSYKKGMKRLRWESGICD